MNDEEKRIVVYTKGGTLWGVYAFPSSETWKCVKDLERSYPDHAPFRVHAVSDEPLTPPPPPKSYGQIAFESRWPGEDFPKGHPEIAAKWESVASDVIAEAKARGEFK